MLGAGVTLLGGLLAAAVTHNMRLAHALRDKDRDLSQLVMKVRSIAPRCRLSHADACLAGTHSCMHLCMPLKVSCHARRFLVCSA